FTCFGVDGGGGLLGAAALCVTGAGCLGSDGASATATRVAEPAALPAGGLGLLGAVLAVLPSLPVAGSTGAGLVPAESGALASEPTGALDSALSPALSGSRDAATVLP